MARKLRDLRMPKRMEEMPTEEMEMDLEEEIPEEDMMAEEDEMPLEEENDLNIFTDEELMAEMEKRGLMGEMEEEEEELPEEMMT